MIFNEFSIEASSVAQLPNFPANGSYAGNLNIATDRDMTREPPGEWRKGSRSACCTNSSSYTALVIFAAAAQVKKR
jgi:hypothetical protein